MNILQYNPLYIPSEIQKEVNKLSRGAKTYGSRYMATFFGYDSRIDEHTDWDFAFPYRGSEYEENKIALSLGWAEKPVEKYKDVMHFKTWEKIVDGHKVQMCSKINLRIFIKTFYSLSPEFYWTYLHKSSELVLPKESQTAIFNQLYHTYESGAYEQ